MKKVVLSTLCILSLAAASPAQAVLYYHWLRPTSLLSRIRTPVDDFYARFSAWWNKDKSAPAPVKIAKIEEIASPVPEAIITPAPVPGKAVEEKLPVVIPHGSDEVIPKELKKTENILKDEQEKKEEALDAEAAQEDSMQLEQLLQNPISAPQNPMSASTDPEKIDPKIESEKVDLYAQVADDILDQEFVKAVSEAYKEIKARIPALEAMPSVEEAIRQIKIGALWAYRLIFDNQKDAVKEFEKKSSQSDYLNAVNALNWFYYAHALYKGRGFADGTNVIQDKGFKFHTFTLNYLKRFNPNITGTRKDPANHFTTNPFGDSRVSSHFKESQKTDRQYGIDYRCGANALATPKFPALKKHLLFGIIDRANELILAKPEKHGLYIKDGLAKHARDYINFATSTNKDDALNSARDNRMPENFLPDIEAALNEAKANLPKKKWKSDHEKIIDMAQKNGLKMLTQLQPDILEVFPKLKKLREDYEKRPEYHHLELRNALEVITTYDEILKSFNPAFIPRD